MTQTIPDDIYRKVILISGLKSLSNKNSGWEISVYQLREDTGLYTLQAVNQDDFVVVTVDFDKGLVMTEAMLYAESAFEETYLPEFFIEQKTQAQRNSFPLSLQILCHRDKEKKHIINERPIILQGYDTFGRFHFKMTRPNDIDRFHSIMASCSCQEFREITSIYNDSVVNSSVAKSEWKRLGKTWIGELQVQSLN